jgi:hypothetical protein
MSDICLSDPYLRIGRAVIEQTVRDAQSRTHPGRRTSARRWLGSEDAELYLDAFGLSGSYLLSCLDRLSPIVPLPAEASKDADPQAAAIR